MQYIFTSSLLLLLLLLLVLSLLPVGTRAQSGNCGVQMENYRQCVKQELVKTGSIKHLTEKERVDLQSDITSCFLNEKCKDPFSNKDSRTAKRTCFQAARNASRTELERCVQKEVYDFVLPQDESDGNEWMQAAASLLSAARNPGNCPLWANKKRLGECIQSKSAPFLSSNVKADVCGVKYACEARISQECVFKWNQRSRPALCRCISNMGASIFQRAKQQFRKCLQDKGYKADVNDVMESLLESSIKGWCPNDDSPDPCPSSAVTKPIVKPVVKVLTTSTTVAQEPTTQPGEEKTAEFTWVPGAGSEGSESTSSSSTTTTTISDETTTTQEPTSTTSLFPNQNFFNSLIAEPLFQNLIGGQSGVQFFQNIFGGKDLISALFPGANVLGGFSEGLSNLFGGNVG